MTLIVVNLLRKFIEEQSTLGGPFDGPGAFFDAMQDFLDSKQARRAVGDAWIGHMVDEAINSGPAIPTEEVFADLRQRSEKMLAVRMREETRSITNDQQAIGIILDHIRDVENAMGGMQFDAFKAITHMHRIVERVLQVLNSALWVLPLTLTDKMDQADLLRLKELAGRTPAIGHPLSATELWEAVVRILPRVKAALNQVTAQTRPTTD